MADFDTSIWSPGSGSGDLFLIQFKKEGDMAIASVCPLRTPELVNAKEIFTKQMQKDF